MGRPPIPFTSRRYVTYIRTCVCVTSTCMSESALASIPIVDVRDGGPVRHALERPGCVRSLREEALGWFPRGMLPLTPALDGLARRWLTHSRAPYVADIAAIAAALGFPGIWFLNN